jgi:UDP-N-acetylmuramate--alanine ligase
MPGLHNVANAIAAVATARELEIPFSVIAEALGAFRGVSRRFEVVGEVNDIILIDDYAHHPTEIRATLATAREAYPGRRIVAVFQPHLYSRTKQFAGEFAEVLSAADVCVLTKIYPAREAPIEGVTSELIKEEAAARGAAQFTYVGVKANALDELARVAKPGDVIITIGAGSITHIRKEILERLHRG